jgi:hypothetical protein
MPAAARAAKGAASRSARSTGKAGSRRPPRRLKPEVAEGLVSPRDAEQARDEGFEQARDRARREELDRLRQEGEEAAYEPEDEDQDEHDEEDQEDEEPSRGGFRTPQVFQTAGGVVLGMIGYALMINYFRGGMSQVKTWLAAKLVNKQPLSSDLKEGKKPGGGQGSNKGKQGGGLMA